MMPAILCLLGQQSVGPTHPSERHRHVRLPPATVQGMPRPARRPKCRCARMLCAGRDDGVCIHMLPDDILLDIARALGPGAPELRGTDSWLAALLYRLLTLWPDRDGLEVMLKRSAKDVVSELTQNVELQAVLKPLFFHPCISNSVKRVVDRRALHFLAR